MDVDFGEGAHTNPPAAAPPRAADLGAPKEMSRGGGEEEPPGQGFEAGARYSMVTAGNGETILCLGGVWLNSLTPTEKKDTKILIIT